MTQCVEEKICEHLLIYVVALRHARGGRDSFQCDSHTITLNFCFADISCTGVLNVLTSLYKVEANCILRTSSTFPYNNCLPLNMVACRQKMCEYGDDIKQRPFLEPLHML